MWRICEAKGHMGCSNTALRGGKVYHDLIYWTPAQFLNLSSKISRKGLQKLSISITVFFSKKKLDWFDQVYINILPQNGSPKSE